MSLGTSRRFSLEKILNEYAADDNGLQKDLRVTIISKTAATVVVSGRKAVAAAATAVRLVAASTPCHRVDVCADLGNTNPVVVGGSGVVAANDAQEGIILIPGNPPVSIEIDDVYKLYVDSQTNDDAVVFNYYTY